MSVETISLPTVISTAVIMNAVVRGAQKAAGDLGDEYFTVVRSEYSSRVISVHKVSVKSASDALSPTQAPVAPQLTIWSMKLSEHDVKHRDNEFFKKNPPRYFFLQRQPALDYINDLETLVAETILKAAGKTADKEN